MNKNGVMRNERDMSTDTRTATALAGRARHAILAVAAVALAPLAAHAQPSDPAAMTDEAFYQRAAVCAAALQTDQLALAARAKAGELDLKPQLQQITKLGFTYVGTAYLRGLRDPRADNMLKAQVAEQKSWDAARHEKVVGECRVEAQGLFDNASSMEQWLVTNRANKRVDKFLGTMNPAPAASR